MFIVEFSTTIAEDGTIVMPADYAEHLPKGEPVHVVVYSEATETSEPDQFPDENLLSLEELVAEIKALPSNPANITPGNMQRLADCLANPVTEPDPAFDVATWNREWDRIEAEINASELAEAEATLKDFSA